LENYIDIHAHTYYRDSETTIVLNTFPTEHDKHGLSVFLSVGLHPWHIQENTWEKNIITVDQMATNHHVLAIGEAGLDKAVNNDYEIQHKAFNAQLTIAESNNKPMIIHCVRSYSELLAYRKKSDQSLPWIFHWFNADSRIAGELMRKNCYLSFGHMLFNEKSKAFHVFRQVSLDRVFFETDDAGFTIKEIYAKAAEMRNIKVPDLRAQIMNNFGHCFLL
jgi:TatD DNase family protein